MIVAVVKNNKKLLEKIVDLLAFFNTPFKVFEDFTEEFFTLMKTSKKKIYILDIEPSNILWLDITKEIRQYDWKSVIIIMSAYDMPIRVFNKIQIFAFINILDNFENQLKDSIEDAIDVLYVKNKTTSIKIIKSGKQILEKKDILYIIREKRSNKCIVKTTNGIFTIYKSLKELEKEFGFERTHKSCIVNMDKVIKIDENKIRFSNGEVIDYVSKKIY